MPEANHRGTEAQRCSGLKYQPFNTVPDDVRFEIEQKPGTDPTQLHVAEKLGIMNGHELINGLEFQNQSIFDDKVESKTASETSPLVFERQTHLPLESNVVLFKLARQTSLIDGLEQSRAHGAMDLDGASNHLSAQRVSSARLGNVIHHFRYARGREKISRIVAESLSLCASVVLLGA
jgi:hypothetical protein